MSHIDPHRADVRIRQRASHLRRSGHDNDRRTLRTLTVSLLQPSYGFRIFQRSSVSSYGRLRPAEALLPVPAPPHQLASAVLVRELR